MSLSDPIGDMLARIKNAQMRSQKKVELPSSKFKCKIAEVLKDEGFIVNFETNSMRFMEKNYENLGTTPTSFSVRDKSSFVVLNRGNLRLTFDWNRFREIYQCYENKI